MPDLFSSNLLEATFRGIPFPVIDFRMSISQDIAEHKRPDQDGAWVESTGRNPIKFNATIPFIVGLSRGPNENWSLSVPLYPERHRQFLAAMADRTAGELQHPSFGKVDVKPVTCSSDLTADMRGGERVEAEWIEANESESDSEGLFRRDPAIDGMWAAKSLDALLSTRPDIQKADPDKRISLSEAFDRIVGVVDRATLFVKQTLGRIDRLTYRLNTLHRALVDLEDPKTWEIRDRIERLNLALKKIPRVLFKGEIGQSSYVVPKDMTVGELAARLNTEAGLLIQSNHQLANKPTVPKGTLIVFWRKQSAIHDGLANV